LGVYIERHVRGSICPRLNVHVAEDLSLSKQGTLHAVK